jgi:hypothetical protein
MSLQAYCLPSRCSPPRLVAAPPPAPSGSLFLCVLCLCELYKGDALVNDDVVPNRDHDHHVVQLLSVEELEFGQEQAAAPRYPTAPTLAAAVLLVVGRLQCGFSWNVFTGLFCELETMGLRRAGLSITLPAEVATPE